MTALKEIRTNPELDRLEVVSKKYFKSLANLANMLGKKRQSLYSYKYRPGLGRKLIEELEQKLKINPKYIQFGEEPMLLGEPRENVESVNYVDMFKLPDIRTLTPDQMKKIKEWSDENIPKIERILETIADQD